MKRKLKWKAFSSFDEMSDFTEALFTTLSYRQRLERFFTILELRQSLGIPPKSIEKGVFVLRKEKP